MNRKPTPPVEKKTAATSTHSPGETSALAPETVSGLGRRNVSANRRAAFGFGQRLQSILLLLSTAAAVFFCVLYMSKPVIVVSPPEPARDEMPAETPVESPPPALADAAPPPTEPIHEEAPPPTPATHAGHEETNLRIQHVLNASNAEGELSRIVLDVPVLYPSRSMRWTDEDVTRAREIHQRLLDYHEQASAIRELGVGILTDWNALIERTIPLETLRADSPSLPINQNDSSHLPRPAALDSGESIEITAPDS